MKRHIQITFLTLWICGVQACESQQEVTSFPNVIAPVARKVPKAFNDHGHERIDDYFWLREKENQEVIDYLENENYYVDSVLAPTNRLQETIYEEIRERLPGAETSIPYEFNGYLYYSRIEEGKQYPNHYRKKGNNEAPEELMLDVNEMSRGYGYYRLGNISTSPDNQLLAYSVDTIGNRRYTIKIRDLKTGKDLPGIQMSGTSGKMVWANDNSTLFTIKPEPVTGRWSLIYAYDLLQKSERLVYEEKDNTYRVSLSKAKSGKYIFITGRSTNSNDYKLINADFPSSSLQSFTQRKEGLQYSIQHNGDKFYIRTNLDAPNFRLMETSEENTEEDHWQPLTEHKADTRLVGMDVFKNFIALSETKEGLKNIRVIDLKTGAGHYLEFDESVYTVNTVLNFEFNTNKLRFRYTSFIHPISEFYYNMETREREKLKVRHVGGNYNPDDYASTRIYAKSADGKDIPISLVYKKSLKKKNGNPTFIEGYGAYGYNIDPGFSYSRASLLDRGFVYAVAHVRGSSIKGSVWYEEGKLFNKKNSFTDFISCAEFLVEEKYADRDLLFADGGSAGGTLMGAVLNMRPDLWRGVVAEHPFVDVVTSMLDDSLPLVTEEYTEWGNPNDRKDFEYMLSYSPYDNVSAKAYPAVLITNALNDSQVPYWEAAKWAAKLRDQTTSSHPVMVKTNLGGGGHWGVSGRYNGLREISLIYGFVLYLSGIEE